MTPRTMSAEPVGPLRLEAIGTSLANGVTLSPLTISDLYAALVGARAELDAERALTAELVAALEAMLTLHGRMVTACGEPVECFPDIVERVDAARAAIAKARGQQGGAS